MYIVSMVKQAARTAVFEPALTIAEKVLLDHERPGVARPKKALLKRAVNRARAQLRPQEPRTLDFEIDGEFIDAETFLVDDIKMPGGQRHFVFATQYQLQLLKHARRWYIDGTFKTMAAECVKVIVRCRPMNTREKDLKCNCCLKMDSAVGQCVVTNPNDQKAPPKSFVFDGSYFTDSTTENIYNEIAYPLVEGVTEGYNGTIFAYGQTGCGKSFTMQGISDPPTQRGIIPRAFDHVFETVSVADTTKFLIHASYCEIYNEEIRDLLGKDVKAKLDLHEHPEKGVYVNGLSQHPVHSVVECNKIMEKGWKNRATGATLMNADSSRSHSIFTIMLEMMTADDEGEEHIRAGKLNLVDLAGSERQAKTGATGDRLKEATKINLSLSALGNVISSLVDGKSKHIPYRDSKLTRLLQDSLGGNTKTLMVACLSPADNNYDETLSTLRYANRAKNIKNKPKINEDPKDALLRQYQEEIERLKAMLMGQIPVPEGGFAEMSGDSSRQLSNRSADDHVRLELEEEKQKIKQEYDLKLEEMQQQFENEKVSKAKLEQDMNKLRQFYDGKLHNIDGQIEKLPTTAETEEGEEGEKDKTKEKKPKPVVVVVKNPDGTPAKDADGKVITKTEYVKEEGGIAAEGNGEPMDRPSSVVGQNLPAGPAGPDEDGMRLASVSDGDELQQSQGSEPGVFTSAPQPQVPVQQPGQAPIAYPDQDKKVTIVNGQMVIRSTKPTGDESILIRPTTAGGQNAVQAGLENGSISGSQAPRSSPTHPGVQDQIRFQQNEALKRLQELEQQMVGGENKDNKELKEKRTRKKKYAEERKRKLAEAIANMDDDGIMLTIYDNIGDELKAKNKALEKQKEKNEAQNREIMDLQSEFEFEKIDYLDTLRKQEREIKLLQEIVDRIQPCVRRDCNYSNIDKVRMQCKWDEEEQKWILPKLTIEKTSLPVGTTLPPGVGNRSPRLSNGEFEEFDDRFREKIMRKSDHSGQYFQTRRANQLVSEPISKVDMGEVKKSYNIQPQSNLVQTNGYGRSNVGGYNEAPMSKELKAAQVHGQIMNDDGIMRKPTRLQALQPVSTSKKSKKKKNNYDDGY